MTPYLEPDGAEIRRLRMGRALSQPDLAALARVDTKTIVRVEAGGIVRLSSVRKIAKALRVKPDAISRVVE